MNMVRTQRDTSRLLASASKSPLSTSLRDINLNNFPSESQLDIDTKIESGFQRKFQRQGLKFSKKMLKVPALGGNGG